MRPLLLSILVTMLLTAPAVGQESVPDAKALIGTWRVDLRPTPGADEYYQQFVVTSVEGNTFEGSFYKTKITEGRINTAWGLVYFAFVTHDGDADYNTSGFLDGDILRGTTHSLGRDFLSVWTAEAADNPSPE